MIPTWLRQYEQEMQAFKEHADWTSAHRRMLMRESAGRDLGNSGADWAIILLFEIVACVVLALAWLR